MFVNPKRRVPLQKRSQERVQRILDAAAELFAERGFDAATMEEIAARAETSIGSVYQFFPNKRAVFDEINRRYHERLVVFFDAIVESPLFDDSIDRILDATVDAVWAFHETDPAFRAVWVGLGFSTDVFTEGEALNKEFARRLEPLLGKKLPGLPAKRRPIVATMLVEVLTAMLILS